MADEHDDILDNEEIENLLSSADAGQGPGATPGAPAEKSPAEPAGEDPHAPESSGGTLDQSQIEALLKQSGPSDPAAANPDSGHAPEQLLDQAEADLAQAMSSNLDEGHGGPVGNAAAFEFEPFEELDEPRVPAMELKGLEDVEFDLHIELGRAELLVEEVLELREGSVVPLDKLAGDPVDILVNGRLIARGEVLVLNDNFCVRVAEILTPDL